MYGQEQAEHKLLSSYLSGRMHHAWLFAGPRGIGKSTMAYRLARFVLRHPDPRWAPQNSLDVPSDDLISKRIASRGHSDLLVIERQFDAKTKRLKQEIGAAEARKASAFFARTAGEEGWRVCIVDAADDLNAVAANALLKILEEPPQKSILLLISHSPGRLLPTIRSRCLQLEFQTLDEQAIERVIADACTEAHCDTKTIASLAGGSAGRAVDLVHSNVIDMFMRLEAMLAPQGQLERAALSEIADKLATRGQDEDYQLFCELLEQRIMQEARHIAYRNDNTHLAARWAKQSSELSHSIRLANALNLDRREVMLEAFETLEDLRRAGRPT